MLKDLIENRLKKLEEYRKKKNPFPAKSRKDFEIKKLLESFDDFEKKAKPVYITGRVMGWRDQGGIIFADIKDGSGKIQAVFEDNTENFKLLQNTVDLGDFLEIHGVPGKTERGEMSIMADSARMIAKSLRPWPSAWFGIENIEERYRRRYLDFVYNEEKAEWLTKFTDMQNTEADRDLTKAEILSSYSKMIIGKQECNDMLLDLGYSQDEVDILISMKEYNTLKEIKDREEKRIRKFYLAGAYTANQAITELGKLDLVGAEQDSIIKLWDSEKLAKLKAPTKKELDTFFSNQVITEPIYIEEMKNKGYTDKYIGWYLELIAKTGAEG